MTTLSVCCNAHCLFVVAFDSSTTRSNNLEYNSLANASLASAACSADRDVVDVPTVRLRKPSSSNERSQPQGVSGLRQVQGVPHLAAVVLRARVDAVELH